jgi:hypothetical protein
MRKKILRDDNMLFKWRSEMTKHILRYYTAPAGELKIIRILIDIGDPNDMRTPGKVRALRNSENRKKDETHLGVTEAKIGKICEKNMELAKHFVGGIITIKPNGDADNRHSISYRTR